MGDDFEIKRYRVIDMHNGKEVRKAFVILPEQDGAARVALAAYAEATQHKGLARWLRLWLQHIHVKRSKQNAEKNF